MTFTVKKAKESKKIISNLFLTKQVLPKKSPQKKAQKKILYKTKKPKELKMVPEIKIEKIEPKIENKIEPKNNKNIKTQHKLP